MLDAASEQFIPMTFNSNISVTLRSTTEMTTFDLPMIPAMDDLMSSANSPSLQELKLGCELLLSTSSTSDCTGTALQLSATLFRCHMNLQECQEIKDLVEKPE